MTKEEYEILIKYLKDIKENYIEGHKYERYSLPEYYAIRSAVKKLDQQPCDDAVSRKAVLDFIKEVCFSKEQAWVDFRFSKGSHGQRDLIIKFIESLPNVLEKGEPHETN